MDNAVFFKQSLKEELVKSEKKRLFITSLILGIGMIDIILIDLFAKDIFLGFFKYRESHIVLYAWIIVFFGFEVKSECGTHLAKSI